MNQKPANSGVRQSKQTLVMAGTAVGLLILHILPLIFPDGRFWGFNHFRFIPDGLMAAFLLMAGLALAAVFMPEAAARGERWATLFDDLFFSSGFKLMNRTALTAIAVFFFLIFSRPTHFLGDGFGYLEIFNRGLVDFESGGWGAALLISGLQELIGGENPALAAFRMISVISGALYIWLLFAVAGTAFFSPLKRLLTVVAGLFSGVILLFFGYVEFYPGLWPIFLAILYFALKSPFEGKNLVWAWGFLVSGIFYHIQMVFLVPAVVYLTFSEGAGANLYRRFRIYIWLLAVILMAMLTAFILNRIRHDIAFENLFLPLFRGKPIDPDYAVFSFKHLADIFNQLMLVIPLFFLLLPLMNWRMGGNTPSRSRFFLFLAGLAGLAFVFFIDPQLCMPRDWDLFALPVWILILAALFYLSDDTRAAPRRYVPVLIIFPAVFTLPFLITNLSETASIRYAESAVRLDSAKTFGAFSVLKEMAENEKDIRRADSLASVYREAYPIARYNQVMELLDQRKFEDAMHLFASIRANRFDSNWQKVRGYYYYCQGDFDRALEFINQAIKLRPYQADYYWLKGMINYSRRKSDSALVDLRRAFRQDPQSPRILDALAYMFSEAGQPDSTINYGEKLVGLDSSAIGGYYLLAKAYAGLSRADKAAFNARRFLQLTEKDTAYTGQKREMESLAGRDSPGADSR